MIPKCLRNIHMHDVDFMLSDVVDGEVSGWWVMRSNHYAILGFDRFPLTTMRVEDWIEIAI